MLFWRRIGLIFIFSWLTWINLFAQKTDKVFLSNGNVITCEIEHIGTEVLVKLEEEGVDVQPSGRVVKVIQDKFVQKVS